MPRYYFHRTDGDVDLDNEGVELPDAGAARTEAVLFAGASLKDEPDQLWRGQDFRIEVADEFGALLFTVVVLAIEATLNKK